MGSAPIVVDKKPERSDIEIKSLGQEKESEIFDIIKDYNVFKMYRLEDLSCLILSLSKNKEEKLITDFEYDLWVSRKILSNILYKNILENEKRKSEFKDFSNKIFSLMCNSFKQFFKRVNNEKLKYKNKLHYEILLAMAFNFCSARNDVKRDFIFDMFCDKDGLLTKGNSLLYFIFSIFAFSSCVQIYGFYEMSNENEEYKKRIEKFDLNNIFQGYEFKDAAHCAEKVYNALFSTKESLSYSEYVSSLNSNNLSFIVNEKSIRKYINENNID